MTRHHRSSRAETATPSRANVSRRRLLQASGAMGLATAFASTSLALTPAERALAEEGAESVKLNVLFIGAHPDDEAGTLATLGQWGEFHDMKVGVITATRGEGGGNAVGLEEGPDLGLIREAEEREKALLDPPDSPQVKPSQDRR